MRLDSGLYRPVQISSIKLDCHLFFGTDQPYRALSASAAKGTTCSVCHSPHTFTCQSWTDGPSVVTTPSLHYMPVLKNAGRWRASPMECRVIRVEGNHVDGPFFGLILLNMACDSHTQNDS